MRGSKTAAKALRRARRLMNNGGAHWAQGALESHHSAGIGENLPAGEYAYCYAGGLQAALFGDGGPLGRIGYDRWSKPAYVEAIIASARAIGYSNFKNAEAQYERALKSPVYADRFLKGYGDSTLTTLRQAFAAKVEKDIFRFNDHSRRKWSEVDVMLERAAASLEVEEHGLGAE